MSVIERRKPRNAQTPVVKPGGSTWTSQDVAQKGKDIRDAVGPKSELSEASAVDAGLLVLAVA